MTEKQQLAVMRGVVNTLLSLAERTSPNDFKVMFGASIANVVGVLPDPYWERMMPCPPCSEAGCNCHEIAETLMKAADSVRTDHIQTMKHRNKGN